jgi:hypothetical protein
MSPRDPLDGMSADLMRIYRTWPPLARSAYLEFWGERPTTRGAHRDTMTAFWAGWNARAGLKATTPGEQTTARAP